jgi:hypothetical protein
MAELPRPYEIMELADGDRLKLRIKGYTYGTIRILPTGWETRVKSDLQRGQIDQALATVLLRDGKPIAALRIVVDQVSKPVGLGYWDITSTTLIAQLLPFLETAGYRAKTFTITAFGVAPKKRFSLEVTP